MGSIYYLNKTLRPEVACYASYAIGFLNHVDPILLSAFIQAYQWLIQKSYVGTTTKPHW